MATREYKNDVLKDGITQRRYAVTPAEGGFSHIAEDESQLAQKGSNFGSANAMGDMVVECDVAVSGNLITISHPDGAPTQFWFTAPASFSAAHIYRFKVGANAPVALTLRDLNGNPLQKAWNAGAPVSLVRIGNNAYSTSGSPYTLQNSFTGKNTSVLFEQRTIVGTTDADGWLAIGVTKDFWNDYMMAACIDVVGMAPWRNKLLVSTNVARNTWIVALANPQGERLVGVTISVNTIRFRGMNT